MENRYQHFHFILSIVTDNVIVIEKKIEISTYFIKPARKTNENENL